MRRQVCRALALLIALALTRISHGGEGPLRLPKKVLVELYTSQGNCSCPLASDLLGRLGKLGYGADRVVTLNFHVDTANDHWVDPYSDPIAGRRQVYYNEVLQRRDLAFTPLMVVDGREPLVGSNRTAALEALERATREEAGVSLTLKLTGTGSKRSLSLRVAGESPIVDGRDLILGVALVEEHVSTKVRSGENAGRTLVEHQVVRRFSQKPAKLDGIKPQIITFPIDLVEGQETARLRLTVFVQDRLNGVVYQAESIPCPPSKEPELSGKQGGKRPKAGRGNSLTFLDPSFTGLQSWLDGPPSCPDCGTPYSSEALNLLPPGYNNRTRFFFPDIPLPMC